MKKILFALAGFCAPQIHAAPACPEPYEAGHPDGGTRVFHLRGDEFFSWEEDADGTVFTRDRQNRLAHAVVANGRLAPRPAGRHGRVNRAEAAALAKEAPREGAPEPAPSSFASMSVAAPPPRKLLVIVAGFTDIAPASTPAFWEERYFGAVGKTVNTYYRAVSKDQFWFEPAAGNGVVFVALPYAHPNPPNNGKADNTTRLAARDALIAASALVDFSAFDANGDGVVDGGELALSFILAGYEGAMGGGLPAPKVWSHFTRLADAPAAPPPVNGVTVGGGGFAMQGECHGAAPGAFASIGVLCHELGHALGLPDLYDTTENSHGVGGHCLMGHGNWGRANSGEPVGATPVFMGAYSRCQAGFSAPEELRDGARVLAAASLATLPGTEVLRVPTAFPAEYFLVENRQPEGFDEGLKYFFGYSAAHGGIAVWHIDEGAPNNNDPARKLAGIKEANELAAGGSDLDNKKNQGRPEHYFYAGGNMFLHSLSTPNTWDNNGRPTGVFIATFSAPGPAMSVIAATTRPETPTGLAATGAFPGHVSLSWQPAPLATSYNVYRSSNVSAARDWIGTTAATGFDDATAAGGHYYTYSVAAENDGAESAPSAPATGWIMPYPLGEAAGAPQYVWTTGGHAPWFGQTNRTLKGLALQSGRVTHNQSTWLQTTVAGPGMVKFYWRCSSERSKDVLWLYINNNAVAARHGSAAQYTNWEGAMVELLSAGNYTFRWAYAKDANVNAGEDAGWLEGFALFNAVSTNTSVPVPYEWLDEFYPDVEPDISAPAMGANGLPVWQSYVAGLDPTDPASRFYANIAVTNGVPFISWKPDLGKARAYTVEGKERLADPLWTTHTNSATRFFRVRVGMP